MKDGEALPPLPVVAAGDSAKPRTPEIDERHKKAQMAFSLESIFVPLYLRGCLFLADVRAIAFSHQSRSTLLVVQAHDKSRQALRARHESSRRKGVTFSSGIARVASLSQR